jgi:GT2 family glycosyltransferase
MQNDANRGFAAACNQGASGLSSQYVLFLNPDTVLSPDALGRTLAFMGEPTHDDVGICGVRMIDEQGAPVLSCARFPTLLTFLGQSTGLSRVWPRRFAPQHLSPDECRTTRDVDQVIGAFFLVRRALFDRLGGFDERFFVYFEEVDFSLRARQRGYRSVHLADVMVQHWGGVSSDQVKAARLFYSLQSRLRYAFKHFSRLDALVLFVNTIGVEFFVRLIRALLPGSRETASEVTRAYLSLASTLVVRSTSR